jgi:hypothetical protein
MKDMTIAKTILEQLGGNRFIAMTGAKNLLSQDNALTFKIGRNSSQVNFVKIELTPDDTYTMTFSNMNINRIKEIKKLEGVYNDMLQNIFTETTGLYTTL